jgi:hypothetical protein
MNTRQSLEYWVIPPDADAEFVACMEEVLDLYELPYDADYPVVCMDEQPVQLVNEVRKPIEATASHPKRIDYEYERAGTASVFMFCEPLIGWRQALVRPQRTKADWAKEVAHLLDSRYTHCQGVRLICDNLNTHTKGAFYEAFPPQQARQYVSRIHFVYTPKHGSWLNVAESELSAMTRQCINGRRMGTVEELKKEVHAWALDINEQQRGVDWQMKTGDARIKLKSIYPKIQF